MLYRTFLCIATLIILFFPFNKSLGWHVDSTHEAITDGAASLKKKIHAGDVNFSQWLTDIEKAPALTYFLTGVHDEDCKTVFVQIAGAVIPVQAGCSKGGPKGPNGEGNFLEHFYDPDTGQGLWRNKNAITRAEDYEKLIKKIICAKKEYSSLSAEEKNKVNDYFGRIIHLMADMGISYHTQLYPHGLFSSEYGLLSSLLEDYVKNNWTTIIASTKFQQLTSLERYRSSNYEKNLCISPVASMRQLAKFSKAYPREKDYYDLKYLYPAWTSALNKERLHENMTELVSESIMFGAGYIDQIYAALITGQSKCLRCPPPDPEHPGDHADDRFDVSDGFYVGTELNVSDNTFNDLLIRKALKKGNPSLFYTTQFNETYAQARGLPADVSKETKDRIIAQINEISSLINANPPADRENTPDVALFSYGFYKPAASLILKKYKEPIRFVGLDFDPAIVKDHPVMFVPGGGFMGLEKSISLKAKLTEYVKNGGTLIALGQQYGSHWELLPVPDGTDGKPQTVQGYGWVQDNSCFANSVYIDTPHQILSGQGRNTPSVNVDGYFTTFPANATVLLRRTANGQPAMLMYDYGRGKVIASTMFSDFASGAGQASAEEIALVRDIITWGKKPAQLPEIRPGETFSVTVTLSNVVEKSASSAKIVIYNPDRTKVLAEQTLSLSIPSRSMDQATVHFSAPSTASLGIYHIDYMLYDSEGNIIQPVTETDSGRFVVSNPSPNPYKSPDFNFSIQSDNENYIYGSSARFTVMSWNKTNSDAQLTFDYFLHNLGPNGSDKRDKYTFTVPAQEKISFEIISPYVSNQGFLSGTFYDQSKKAVGSAYKGIWGEMHAYHQIKTTIKTDKANNGRGETVHISVVAENPSDTDYITSLYLEILEPDNDTAVQRVKFDNVFLPAQNSATIAHTYKIPAAGKTGSYRIIVRYPNAWPYPSGTFYVKPPDYMIEPRSFGGSVSNGLVSFFVINKGLESVSTASLSLSLKAPDGSEQWNKHMQVTPPVIGQGAEVPAIIPFQGLVFGSYRLDYSLNYGVDPSAGHMIIANSAFIEAAFDKMPYSVRDVADLTVSATNTGSFNLENVAVTIAIPDISYSETKSINLLKGQTVPVKFSIPVPATINAGTRDVVATMSLPSGSAVSTKSVLVVLQSSLIASLSMPSQLNAGDIFSLTVQNTGGVDTEYSAGDISLNDSRGNVLYQTTSSGAILAGESKKLADIIIPGQVTQDSLRLSGTVTDTKTGKKEPFVYWISVKGLTASIEAQTDKNIYFKTDAQTAFSRIINGQLPITGGALKLVVNKVDSGNSSSFEHFLPKYGYSPLSMPDGIAISDDGSIYVANSGSAVITQIDSTGKVLATIGEITPAEANPPQIHDVTIGPDGSLYICDSRYHQVLKYDQAGHYLTKLGTYGAGDGQFAGPMGIAAGPDGSLYVADSSNYRIQKFDANGTFITKWGSQGAGDGQFDYPYAIRVGGDGFIYVVDRNNRRIQKFDSNGTFITKWGSQGAGDGQFEDPQRIATGSNGDVFVTDSYRRRIQKFDQNGTFLKAWRSTGDDDAAGDSLYGIAVSRDGVVYITEGSYDKIGNVQKFDLEGNFQSFLYEKTDPNVYPYSHGPITVGLDNITYIAVGMMGDSPHIGCVLKYDQYGSYIGIMGCADYSDSGYFYPSSIAVGPNGTAYVVEQNFSEIYVFERNGNTRSFGTVGINDGELRFPSDVAVAADGTLYVADTGNHRIQKLDSEGRYLGKWGSPGSGDGQFSVIGGIAVSADGFVYVADTENQRVQKFDVNGNYIARWDTRGEGVIFTPNKISVAPDKSIFIIDSDQNYVVQFSADGNFMRKYGGRSPLIPPMGIAPGRLQGDSLTETSFYGLNYLAISPTGAVYAMDLLHTQKLTGSGLLNKVFETTIPVSLAANATQQFTTNIGTLNTTGKFYLEATLANSIGSTVAQSAYPFYIVKENIAVIFSTDKKQYRPGETVTIRGEVKNLAPVTAGGVAFTLTQKTSSGSATLYTATFDLPANGSHPFTTTIQAGQNGTYVLNGNAVQNSVSVFESTDYYDVVLPAISATVTVPETAGNDPFTIKVDIANTGRADGTVTMLSSIDGQAQTLLIPQGTTKTITYRQQISENKAYTFTLGGDTNQTVTKTVLYGLASTITLNASATYPAGRITIPVTITNTGSLDGTIPVTAVLQPGGITITKTYFVPKTGSITDSLLFDLAEGDYELVVSSQAPPARARAAFAVRREVNVAMAPLVTGSGPGGAPAVTATLTNSGFSSLNGSARISIVNAQGATVWQGTQSVSVPSTQPPTTVPITIPYNTTSLPSGNYTVTVELFNGNGQLLASQGMPLVISSPVITLSLAPQALTVRPGENALFIFKVSNSGGKEGMAEISFNSYDFINTIRREAVRPGEEKDISFSFAIPSDLEEKDYFANYEFRSEDGGTARGQVKYHFSGINLTVNASLDKQKYKDGDTARLTLSVAQPAGASSQNLFVRINYPGYEENRPFTLSGSQTLAFDVPLAAITGEKLFYGIYHASGRAIHLNSLYVYKEGSAFTVTTNKQVYNPGEMVTMSITGTATGTMTLSAPNNYTDTFTFSGSATKSFLLPSAATAGTYYINASLRKSDTETISASIPFDIAGIQVKIKESLLDKGKYGASDTIKLSLKIESTVSLPATLKVWSMDPDKNSNLIGQKQITLTASEPLLVVGDYPFVSHASGIHRLIYGIYSGDLLLVTGGLGFDVGTAVLLGLSTDRVDYPGGSEQVAVRANMCGAAGASFTLELDGTPLRTDNVALNGFHTVTLPLVNIQPGLHILKGTLTAGGLASSKETSFLYGSGLPDLVSDVWADTASIGKDAVMKFTVSAANTGKSAAPATTVTLSDGSSPVATYTAEGLLPGGRAPFEYTMNAMGKAGERIFKAIVDPGNLIPELNEDNNTATRTIRIPDLVVITETGKDTYKACEQVPIHATVLNLTPTTFYPNLTLLTAVRGPAGTEVYRKSSTISVPASQASSFSESWNTAGLSQEGVHTITQTILYASQVMAERKRNITVQKASGFVLRADAESFTVTQGQPLTFPVMVDAVMGWTSEVVLGTEGTPPGMTISITPRKLVPSGSATVTVNTVSLQPGTHTLTITGQGVENGETVLNTLDVTIQVVGFALSYEPQSITIRQNESAQATLAVSAENGYTGNITLSPQGVPRGLRVTANLQTTSVPASVTVTIQSSKHVSPGNYSIGMTATDGVTTKSIHMPVTVTQNPELTRGYITTPGPSPLNPAIVTVFNKDFTPVLELTAFPTKFGAVAVMGDIDGDGEDEIVVAPGPDPNAEGILRIFKKNGSLLLEKKIFDTKFGLTLAAGDIDGDWKEEIIVGVGPDPRNIARIKVLSYANNTLIDTGIDFNPFPKKKNCLLCSDLYFGTKVAVGDVNNDGILEIIAGAGPSPLNPARVGIFTVDTVSGPGKWKIGSTFSDFTVDFGDWQNLSFGVNVAAGDIDGDGCDEIIAGAGPNPLHEPVVKVYKADGVSTGISFHAYPPKGASNHYFGAYVASGDLTGDGTTKIITGLGPSPMNKSWVRIFDSTGTLLSNGFYAYPDTMMFGVRVSTGNVGE